jgi:GntR family histidine utilization transcriptional repressor
MTVPAYQRIKQHVLRHIDAGDWRPGDQVPSENALVREHGLSRMTVHRALRELTMEGRLIRVQGSGTYVAEPKPQSALLEIRPIDEEISDRGGVYRATVVEAAKVPANEDTARLLDVGYGADVFHVVLVHSEDDLAIQVEDRYVNPAVAPDFLKQDFTTTTPSRYLVDTIPVNEIEHVIEAVRPSAREAKLLGISGDEPCLVLSRRTWSGDKVVTRVRLTSPGNRRRLGGRFEPFGSG